MLSPSALLPIGTVPILPTVNRTVRHDPRPPSTVTDHLRRGHFLTTVTCMFIYSRFRNRPRQAHMRTEYSPQAACPGHGRPGNTSPLAPSRRSTAPHHTAHRKAVEGGGGREGERAAPTVGPHPPHPIPEVTELTWPTTILGYRISVSMCIPSQPHTSSQMAHSLSLCLKWARPRLCRLLQSTPHSPQTDEALHPSLKRTPRHCHPRQTRPSRVAETCSRVNAPSRPWAIRV